MFPTQTFSTMQQLINYINTLVVPNGDEEITGEIHNNVENGLANFIVQYTLNSGLVSIISSGGNVVLPSPMTMFIVNVPTSIQWTDNVQNEYYIINGTGFNIPLANGFSYVDTFLTNQTVIPARSAVHIAKAGNNSWIQVNNVNNAPGVLPPQTGHEGEVLFTTGASAFWGSPLIHITSSDFEPDGVTYINTNIPETVFRYEIFLNEVPRFIYNNSAPPEWGYISGGGFEILMPWFDANNNDYNLYLFLKGINS